MLNPFVSLISQVIWLYTMVLIAACALSILISFDILNRNQPLVYRLNFVLNRLTEPVLRHIRRYLPDLGGVDISPILLILLLNFIDNALRTYL